MFKSRASNSGATNLWEGGIGTKLAEQEANIQALRGPDGIRGRDAYGMVDWGRFAQGYEQSEQSRVEGTWQLLSSRARCRIDWMTGDETSFHASLAKTTAGRNARHTCPLGDPCRRQKYRFAAESWA